MDHPFKKITGVWGRWGAHLLLVVYEDQRTISWSLFFYLCRLQGWNSDHRTFLSSIFICGALSLAPSNFKTSASIREMYNYF